MMQQEEADFSQAPPQAVFLRTYPFLQVEIGLVMQLRNQTCYLALD